MKFLSVTLLTVAGLVAADAARTVRLNSAEFRAMRKLDQAADDADAAADEAADDADAAVDADAADETSTSTPYWPEREFPTAGAIEFLGCHTFITGQTENDGNANRNYYNGQNGQYQQQNAQYQYSQNAYNKGSDYQTTSYVILGGNFPTYNSNNNNDADGNDFYYEDSENEMKMQKAAMTITDYMTTIVAASENQRYEDCKICQSLQYYCFPPEQENLNSGGSTNMYDGNGNVIAHVSWDAAWDWSKSEQQNMGAYYGLDDAVSCDDCVAKNCYPYENYANMWEYMAQNVYGTDFETFSQYAFKEVYQKYADINGGEYPGEFADLENMFDQLDELLYTIPECTQIDGTDYYAGWTCTSSGNGIQRAVFTDNECSEYVKINYEDIAMNDADGFAAFSYAMENLDISDVLTNGLTCDASHLTVGSGIEERYGYDMYGNQLDYDTYLAEKQANGYSDYDFYSNPQLNEMCYSYKYKEMEGQIDISSCDAYSSAYSNAYGNNDYGNNVDGDQDAGGNVNAYYQNQAFQAELDPDEIEQGNLAQFCTLIKQDFGSSMGSQEIQDSSITYTPKEKKESAFAALGTGTKAVIWAIIILATVVVAVAAAMAFSSYKKSQVDAPEFKQPLSPNGSYVAA